VRDRRLLPIGLVALVYLLNAMASTSVVAETAAADLMTGRSGNSLGIAFDLKDGVAAPWGGAELVLAIQRQGSFFVVERQPDPPAQRPASWVVPASSIDSARLRRLNDADDVLVRIVVGDEEPTPGQ
jgi:hypothetical protein